MLSFFHASFGSALMSEGPRHLGGVPWKFPKVPGGMYCEVCYNLQQIQNLVRGSGFRAELGSLSLSLSAGLLRDNYRLWLEALVQYLVAERARNVVNIYSYLRQALLRCQTWGSCQLQTMYLYFSSSRSPLQHRTWRSWLCFTLWFVQL